MDHFPFLLLQDVGYYYPGAEEPALKYLNLKVKKGEWLALLGGNGSGKSTLAKNLNALLIPLQGACFVEGKDSRDEANLWDIRKTVSMVFQNPENQIVSTVVEDDTAFGPENLGLPSEEIRLRVDRALKVAGLFEKASSASYTLSGGQKQRLAIAGAIAMETACIVLDEPTAMLDPKGRLEIIELLKTLHSQGVTVIHITHRLEEITYATRALVLQKGSVVFDGSPGELFTQKDLSLWGLELPPVVSLWRDLRDSGIIDEKTPPEVERLVEDLCP